MNLRDRVREAGRQLNEGLNRPAAQGALATANAIASIACYKASVNAKRKGLYRAACGILATFATYHVIKAIQEYRQAKKR